MRAGLFDRPHSMASSPLGMLSTVNPYGASSPLISSTVALSGSMHSRTRSAIGLSPPQGRPYYQNPKGFGLTATAA